MKDGYVTSFDMSGTGTVSNTNPIFGIGTNTDPGFFIDSSFKTSYNVRLPKAVGTTISLNSTWPKIQYQYVQQQSYETRTTTSDIGAYMYSSTASPGQSPVSSPTQAPVQPGQPTPTPVIKPNKPTACIHKGKFCFSWIATRCCSKHCSKFHCT